MLNKNHCCCSRKKKEEQGCIVLSRCSKKVNSINSHQKVEFYTNNLSKNLKATNDLKIIENFDHLLSQ